MAEGVHLLTWDRPEVRNALDATLWDLTRDALRSANADPTAGAIVLTGAGGSFSAGADLADMAEPHAIEGDPEDHGYQGVMRALEDLEVPLLAAVDGPAVGVGMTLLGHCDLVWCSPRARFRAPFVPLGITLEAGSSVLLPARMGAQVAALHLLTGDWLDAQGAAACGLVLEVLPQDRLVDEVLAVARRLAALPKPALRATRRLLAQGRSATALEARRREDAAFAALVGTPENLAAIAAFRGR